MAKIRIHLESIEEEPEAVVIGFPDKSYRFSNPVPRHTGPEVAYNFRDYKKIQESEQLPGLRRGA